MTFVQQPGAVPWLMYTQPIPAPGDPNAQWNQQVYPANPYRGAAVPVEPIGGGGFFQQDGSANGVPQYPTWSLLEPEAAAPEDQTLQDNTSFHVFGVAVMHPSLA